MKGALLPLDRVVQNPDTRLSARRFPRRLTRSSYRVRLLFFFFLPFSPSSLIHGAFENSAVLFVRFFILCLQNFQNKTKQNRKKTKKFKYTFSRMSVWMPSGETLIVISHTVVDINEYVTLELPTKDSPQAYSCNPWWRQLANVPSEGGAVNKW